VKLLEFHKEKKLKDRVKKKKKEKENMNGEGIQFLFSRVDNYSLNILELAIRNKNCVIINIPIHHFLIIDKQCLCNVLQERIVV